MRNPDGIDSASEAALSDVGEHQSRSGLLTRLLALLMPTDYFEVKEEVTPRGQHPTMWFFASCTYVLVILSFVLLMVFGLHRSVTIESIQDRDRTTENPLQKRRGFSMFIKPKNGRRRCDMLLRLSQENEFESTALSLTGDSHRATYAYYLARVKERYLHCISDLDNNRLGFRVCEDDTNHWALVNKGSTAYDGFAQLKGLTASGDFLYTYALETETLVRYDIRTGQFTSVFSNPNRIALADSYGITVTDDNTLYMVCSTPTNPEAPSCGLIRYYMEDDFLERVFSKFGSAQTSITAKGNYLFIADPNAQTVWLYEHSPMKVPKEDNVLPVVWVNASNSNIRQPISITASESYIWILDLDGPRIHRCTQEVAFLPQCSRLVIDSDLLEYSVEISARPNDAGLFIFDLDVVKVHIIDFDGNLMTLAEGPNVMTSSGTTISAQVSNDALYFVTDSDDGLLSRFDQIDRYMDTSQINAKLISSERAMTFDIATGWFACDDKLIINADVPETLADMIDYSEAYCKRAGLAFQALYSLDFFNATQAMDYARIASRRDCTALDTQNTICDAVANNPPYLCEYESKEALFDVFATAFANTELLFIAVIFFSAAILTCISHYYKYRPNKEGNDLQSRPQIVKYEEQDELEARIALLEKSLSDYRQEIDEKKTSVDHDHDNQRRDIAAVDVDLFVSSG